MRSIVIYSSLTGNTKRVAEAIVQGLPEGTPCVSTKEIPADIADYDVVFCGFWVDRGTANKAAQDVLATLNNPYVVLFATLGMYADSDHARESIDKAELCLPNGKKAYDGFVCQGAIDPKVIEMMYKMFPPGSAHGQSPERDALHAEAAKHPDEADLSNAKAFAGQVFEKICHEGVK